VKNCLQVNLLTHRLIFMILRSNSVYLSVSICTLPESIAMESMGPPTLNGNPFPHGRVSSKRLTNENMRYGMNHAVYPSLYIFPEA